MSDIKTLKDRLTSIEEGTFRSPLDVIPLEPGAGTGPDSPAGAVAGAVARNPNVWRSGRTEVKPNPAYTGAGNLPVRRADYPVEPPPISPAQKPRITVRPGETQAQAIERIKRTAPTVSDEVKIVDPATGRVEPPPFEESTEFPGYWRGGDPASAAKSKMVGMEESIIRRARKLMDDYQRFKGK